MTDLVLEWHPYTYFPYERELAVREVTEVLAPAAVEQFPGGLLARACAAPERAHQLVYVRSSRRAGETPVRTRQHFLETSAARSEKRQPTRYSAHGLHEYKGKFNPQTAQALMNLAGLEAGRAVLDPYCGSGTTLLEASHRGAPALGLDVNPLAVLVSRTKAALLSVPADRLDRQLTSALAALGTTRQRETDGDRIRYLRSWLPPDVLQYVERVDAVAESLEPPNSTVLRLLVSDLLRDYSLQEPQDLRVRRRRTPLPERPLASVLADRCDFLVTRLAAAQAVLGPRAPDVVVARADVTALPGRPAALGARDIGAIITSPPYAMALPYIDTQRLSLVWLGLVAPGELKRVEAQLTGSREVGSRDREALNAQLRRNEADLPDREHDLCRLMLTSLDEGDGFRRRSVPALLYRYFAAMRCMFGSLRRMVGEDVPYFLVVGRNRTTLGGRVFAIDTPAHLAGLAQAAGWGVEEVLPLQAYRRFGLHARNAVESEALVHLRAK